MRRLPFDARLETRRGRDGPLAAEGDRKAEGGDAGAGHGSEADDSGNATERGLGEAATVVCARMRPCEFVRPCVGTEMRSIVRPMRSLSVGAGVPFSMSSARRGCLRASARNMCPPATGGAGLSVIECSEGLLEISRSAVFQTAGSSAWTALSDGAWARARTS